MYQEPTPAPTSPIARMFTQVPEPSYPASLEGELAAHPYATALIVALLFAAFVAAVKLLLALFEQRINEKFKEVQDHNTEQDGRLDKIDSELNKYDQHVAIGQKESQEIHGAIIRVEAALADHVRKEEGTTWVKIDSLVDAVNQMRLQNEVAHVNLSADQKILVARVEAVEEKMPNGELKKLAEAYHKLAERDIATESRLAGLDPKVSLERARARASSRARKSTKG